MVFSSINYGTDTSAEGRCIIRELLKSTYRGVGNGETAIFPIQIWKKKRGVSYLPEDRNYDLYELACKVTARRFFPNFLNLDATFNQHEDWRADDPERYTVRATRHSASPMNPIPSVPWLITGAIVSVGFNFSLPSHKEDISSGNCLA